MTQDEEEGGQRESPDLVATTDMEEEVEATTTDTEEGGVEATNE